MFFRPAHTLIAATLVATTLATAAQAAESKVLNVYNWSDYIADDTIKKPASPSATTTTTTTKSCRPS